ncbi:hypothetical protein TRAPUB_8097 [Trametes pubescens]|uniref:Uncharacterized protein n=1 Tax=Trametes pubescens TaxID=154538 RepID=A0A1M2W651_TRAPU|nr:hypothetical protein TRAPUB_8097 [Trametes pubescens]
MNATSYTTFTAVSPRLPPTSNVLDARQRTRLIRTTRKLGAVLGTTPQLLEQDSPCPSPPLLPIAGRRSPVRKTSAYAKRRQGSVFELPPPTAATFYDSSSDASSSASSLFLPRPSLDSVSSVESSASLPAPKSFTRHVREKSKSKGKQAPLPSPLVLRLNAVPLPPSDPRVQYPITPDTSGTLTFAQSASLSGGMLPVTPTTPITPTATETRRKRLAKLKRTLGENVPAELILPFRSSPRSRRQSTTTSPASSSTAPSPVPPTPRVQATLPRLKPQPQPNRRRSMSVDFSQPQQTQSAPECSPTASSPASDRPNSRVWVTGAGTWTGEWNRKDIREVQHQLRALRMR